MTKKQHFISSSVIALWIIVLIVIKDLLGELGFTACWIFTAIIMFFAFMPEGKYRILSTLCGAASGIILGIFIFAVYPLLEPLFGEFAGHLIPTAIAVYLIVAVGALFPVPLNNTSFGYLILSTIRGREALMNHIPEHFLMLAIGGPIAIYSVIFIKKYFNKKYGAHH